MVRLGLGGFCGNIMNSGLVIPDTTLGEEFPTPSAEDFCRFDLQMSLKDVASDIVPGGLICAPRDETWVILAMP